VTKADIRLRPKRVYRFCCAVTFVSVTRPVRNALHLPARGYAVTPQGVTGIITVFALVMNGALQVGMDLV
jgi:hypothetical protein